MKYTPFSVHPDDEVAGHYRGVQIRLDIYSRQPSRCQWASDRRAVIGRHTRFPEISVQIADATASTTNPAACAALGKIIEEVVTNNCSF